MWMRHWLCVSAYAPALVCLHGMLVDGNFDWNRLAVT
jgi:hypothetical protein